jgi:hypothetical protein
MLRFPNQIASCNAIDIFENLTMNKGPLIWVEFFWNYNVHVIDYWTILLYSNPNMYLVLLESSH